MTLSFLLHICRFKACLGIMYLSYVWMYKTLTKVYYIKNDKSWDQEIPTERTQWFIFCMHWPVPANQKNIASSRWKYPGLWFYCFYYVFNFQIYQIIFLGKIQKAWSNFGKFPLNFHRFCSHRWKFLNAALKTAWEAL